MRFGALLLLILLSIAVAAQVKKTEPPSIKVPFSQSLQAVVVTTKNWTAIQGTARLFERKERGTRWKAVGNSFPVVVGRSGLGITREDAWQMDLTSLLGRLKKEGDGKSPAGLFPLTTAFGTANNIPQGRLAYTKLEEFTECVDDVNSSFYNRIVNRLQVGNFDWNSSEKMAAVMPEYELGVFVAYNSYPQTKGNGSCIFLHIWKNQASPTSGCTAMTRPDLERLVAWLEPEKAPYLVQMPEDQYLIYRKQWNLPKLK